MLRRLSARLRTIELVWPEGSPEAATSREPRGDIVAEQRSEHVAEQRSEHVAEQRSEHVPERMTFTQSEGPFAEYTRTVTTVDGDVYDTTVYRLLIPWFGWLFAWPMRHALRNRRADRKSTRLNSSHSTLSRMPSSA